ncbi:MAG: hypothetical protein HY376_03600 [Candidatus Blackburnbacteria bacterium]|nr:hypothetical protein [Candidatus Blackburnbacteria bacterium]
MKVAVNEAKDITVKIVRQLDEVQKAWLAAAIDGEGCISYSLAGLTKTGKKKWLNLFIGISNTDRRFLDAAQNFVGAGSIHAGSRYSYGKKVCYQWMLKGHQNIESLLIQIEPYLIIKKDKAIKMLEIIKTHKWKERTWEGKLEVAAYMRKRWEDPIYKDKMLKEMRGRRVPCTTCGRLDGVFDRHDLCHNCYQKLWMSKKKARISE